jgi:hypothetical protein
VFVFTGVQVRDSFVSVSATNVFSTNCVAHVLFDTISNVSVQGHTLHQVVQDWYIGALNDFYLVDCCTEVDCNPTCGAPCDYCTYIEDCSATGTTGGMSHFYSRSNTNSYQQETI